MRKRLGILATVLALGLFLAPANAGGTWKIVVRVKGKVQSRLASANKWIPVFSSRLLKDGQDRVRTLDNSVGQLRGSDDSVVNIGPGTELTITEFVPESARAKFKIENPGGSVMVKLGRFFRGERSFRVETPNSVLSAKGTEFIVVYSPDSAQGTTVMDVLTGEVSGLHNNQPVSVPAGFRFTTDGKNFSLQPSPPDFLGVPQVLVPAGTRAAATKIERGTVTQGEERSPGPGGSSSGATGVYLNPLLPAFEGAATLPIVIDLTVVAPDM